MSVKRLSAAIIVGLALPLLLFLLRPTRTSDAWYVLAYLGVALALGTLIIGLRHRIVQVVKTGELGIIERGGRLYQVVQPGPVILLPVFENLLRLALTEQLCECDEPHILTLDGVQIGARMLVRYRLQGPTSLAAQKAVYEVPNWHDAVRKHAIAALHQRMGSMSVDDVVTTWTGLGREIASDLQATADGWGVAILSIELYDVKMPEGIAAALEDQRKAAIEARSVDYRASAQAERIRLITKALRECGLPDRLLPDALQTERYIQAMESMSSNPSTHTVLPVDFLRRLEPQGHRLLSDEVGKRQPEPMDPDSGPRGDEESDCDKPASPERDRTGRSPEPSGM